MTDLAAAKCKPCEGGIPAIKGDQLQSLLKQVQGWEAINEHHLLKTFNFPDFRRALEFVNRVGEIAEEEGHHPYMCFTWGKVEVKIWTHAIDGLSENDFILAAKIDRLGH